MNIYADTLDDLAYAEGTVCFCLESDKSAYAGTTVHMPFAAFCAMLEELAGELDTMAAAHDKWVAGLKAPPANAEAAKPAKRASKLGRKIASV